MVRTLKRLAALLLLSALCLPCFAFAALRAAWLPAAFRLGSPPSSLDSVKSSPLGKFRLLAHFLDSVPENELALAFRTSDFVYYSGRKMLYEGDPALFDFYRCKDKLRAYEILKSLGVRHVLVPSHLMPTVTDSMMMEILADPSLSRLVFSSSFNRHFILKPREAKPEMRQPVDSVYAKSDFLFSSLSETLKGADLKRPVIRMDFIASGSGQLTLAELDGGATLWQGFLTEEPKRMSFQAPGAGGAIVASLPPGAEAKLEGIEISAFDLDSPCALDREEDSGLKGIFRALMRSKLFESLAPAGWMM